MEFVVTMLFIMAFFYLVKWGSKLTSFLRSHVGSKRDRDKPFTIGQIWTNGSRFLTIELIQEDSVYYTNHIPRVASWSDSNYYPGSTRKMQKTVEEFRKIIYDNQYYLTGTIPNEINIVD